jgi:Mg2+ and Co2+ transporter CorA
VKQVSAEAAGAIDYGWYKLNVFTAWHRHTGRTMVSVFDAPPSAKEVILHRLLCGLHVELLGDPFWMYARLVEEVVSLQDRAVWAIRDRVRATENQRWAEWQKPDYIYLHDMARHAIHVAETLDVATNTLDGILAHHRRTAHLLDTGARLGDSSAWASASTATANRLLFFQDMLRSLRVRAASNKERLQNEIELAFNLVTQCDARISLNIGRAAQADGAAMRTVAFVTLAFLPATFVCAIFSMSFFDYDSSSGSWSVSGDFWRYWAVAVPVTVCTALLWLAWTKLFPPMPIGGAGEMETLAGARARMIEMLGEMPRGASHPLA